MRVSRRTFLAGASALGIGSLIPIQRANAGEDLWDEIAGIDPQKPLQQYARQAGVDFGTSARKVWLETDPAFAAAVVREASILVPELELKWDALRPSPDTYEFGPADWMCQFAANHRMKVRGHTLVWFNALPSWFEHYVKPANAERVMENHICSVMKHFGDRVDSWDVVNEPISHEDGRQDGLRLTPWLKLLGPEYIETAFRIAASVNPKAQLVLNETWLESANAKKKRIPTLKLLTNLRSKNIPLHALGVQGHVRAGEEPGGMSLEKFLHEVEELGLEVLVTEMDVRDQALPSDPSLRDRGVAACYCDFLGTVLKSKSLRTVVSWGISDRYTWIQRHSPPRADGLSSRPLPLDQNLEQKLAWKAIASAFANRRNA